MAIFSLYSPHKLSIRSVDSRKPCKWSLEHSSTASQPRLLCIQSCQKAPGRAALGAGEYGAVLACRGLLGGKGAAVPFPSAWYFTEGLFLVHSNLLRTSPLC